MTLWLRLEVRHGLNAGEFYNASGAVGWLGMS
jgi:hypothetical protein